MNAISALLRLKVLAAAFLLAGAAFANDYPVKPVRLLVPAAPGGGADFLARIVGLKLGEAMGQPVVIDNRAGASGTIAADATAKAAADGYTVLMGQSTSIVIAPQLYQKLNYDTLRDLIPVTLVAEVPNVLVVHPSVSATSVKDLIAMARAKPDLINFASSGNGAPSHLAGEMFKAAAGVKLTHVPYKGAGPAVNGLIAGEIQVMFAPIVAVLPHVKSGRLRALAVTSAARSAAAPELPTLAESGLAGYDISSWFGLFVPARTPAPVVDRLYRETSRILKSQDVIERFAKEGAEPVGSTPVHFNAYVRQEFVKYTKVIKDNGIKSD
ncbi:MAG: tripartite tricarboxylate transporter substrate binding protein [Polaromonas sp.]|uniref:tripartite tricarboxylate transporter substrate binding protein n=1 Tax=Polaromonas sp. TaxID=1869339 RepID=UPI002733AA30|nr:tripartite tricarboxylate transporter substrate binding protein [Polaromonas sp.]MDP3799523.1 tripartite tricarboxylate transporter substrate binding protein [Polaromonas sp.]